MEATWQAGALHHPSQFRRFASPSRAHARSYKRPSLQIYERSQNLTRVRVRMFLNLVRARRGGRFGARIRPGVHYLAKISRPSSFSFLSKGSVQPARCNISAPLIWQSHLLGNSCETAGPAISISTLLLGWGKFLTSSSTLSAASPLSQPRVLSVGVSPLAAVCFSCP